MYSASDLISALLERPRSRLWFRASDARPVGEFPPGWRAWFAAMRERIDAVRGATADAIVAIFLGRELSRPGPRSPLLNDWQAFAALWRQQWQPASEGERRQRIVALAITLVVHVVFFILLLWLAYVRFSEPPPPAGEDVVQVEYIGEGTPDSPGGGARESAVPATQTRAKPTSNPATASQPPAPAASASTSEQPPARTPAETMPLPDQPLVVTETPLPDPRFALPPTSPPQLQPTVAPPRIEVPLQSRAVPLAEQPQPLPSVAMPRLDAQQATPTLRANAPSLSARDIPLPQALPQISTPALQATKPTTAPTLQGQAALQSREVPLQPGTATTPAPGAVSSTAPSSAPSAPGSNAKPQPSSGTLANTAAPGSGPSTAAKPGAWPTPKRGDDWGDSNRNRPGGVAGAKNGLLNSDGTPRLPQGTAEPGGGYPPGYDTWTREAIDRNGTWLKRPPNKYTPTMFDQYWLPRETLLEEWVRKGIKQTEIPIPGTSKKIHCVVSILQLGGGCYVTDPNLNDQEATARPPPDIPWKPELQEDQDSLEKPSQP